MSRLQLIERALMSINGAVFQELGDKFLLKRNSNYAAFSRTGSVSGKQKTSKGTPDSFFLAEDGRYIFVEFSTNETSSFSKIKDDIVKCIDEKKTDVPVADLKEVIICANFNLKTGEIKELRDVLAGTGVLFTIYTLDSFSLELHLHHRDLVHEYLGLPLDTGQIVSIERFIREYGRAANGIATALDNQFLHRELEAKQLAEAIDLHDFVILTGPAGVGKTKLAIEVVQSYAKENRSFEVFAVSYKEHVLLDDLYQYIDAEKDYILFVDDANRIDAFGQIVGFYKSPRKGKLKILITVRDYALEEVTKQCFNFAPAKIQLERLTDDQIKDIIESESFNIKNPDYQREIIRIAGGNPRLAIMAAKLAIAEQNLHVLRDVSDLFEKYFGTFVNDKEELASSINLRCLGIIAFFNAFPYKNREYAEAVLAQFDIEYGEFADAIDFLNRHELIDIQFEFVKIPEQNLATYFFYRCFLRDQILSFSTLLNHHYPELRSRFTDTLVPSSNTFGYKNVDEKVKPALKARWNEIKNNPLHAWEFLQSFWAFLADETLEYVYLYIEALPEPDVPVYDTHYEHNAIFRDENKVLQVIQNFLNYPFKFKDAIELAIAFVTKVPQETAQLTKLLREKTIFDKDDRYSAFQRQTILFDLLIGRMNNGEELSTSLFFELAPTFLHHRFRQTRNGGKMSIIFYEFPLPETLETKEFRNKLWTALKENFDRNSIKARAAIKVAIGPILGFQKWILQFDIDYLVEIIDEHFSEESLADCKMVDLLTRVCRKQHLESDRIDILASKFRTPRYEAFKKLDWNRFRDKEEYEFDNQEEYEALKEAEIRESFVFESRKDVERFYSLLVEGVRTTDSHWNIGKTVEIILKSHFEFDFDRGFELLQLIIEHENEINFHPGGSFKNILNSPENSTRIWNLIDGNQFPGRLFWKLNFFARLDDLLVDDRYAEEVLIAIKESNSSAHLHFDWIQKYRIVRPSIVLDILNAVYSQNEIENGPRFRIFIHSYKHLLPFYDANSELIEKTYLQQDRIDQHYDYGGKVMLELLRRNPMFLVTYLDRSLTNSMGNISDDHRRLGFVWELKGIKPVINTVFDMAHEKLRYTGILTHYYNVFFRDIPDEHVEKADSFIFDYIDLNAESPSKINAMLDIVRNSRKEIFDDVLLRYLSQNEKVDDFANIHWRGNSRTYTGNVIIGDIEAAEWRAILETMERSSIGIKLIPIKKYVNDQIEFALRSGEEERKRRFIGDRW